MGAVGIDPDGVPGRGRGLAIWVLGFLCAGGFGKWVLGVLGFWVLERDMGSWGSWGFEEGRVLEREVSGPPWEWRRGDLEDLLRREDGIGEEKRIWVMSGMMMRRR